jgi:hypothetical protein
MAFKITEDEVHSLSSRKDLKPQAIAALSLAPAILSILSLMGAHHVIYNIPESDKHQLHAYAFILLQMSEAIVPSLGPSLSSPSEVSAYLVIHR